MMTAWSDLPNAAHIDRVLASLKVHPEAWTAAWLAWPDATGQAGYQAREAARAAACGKRWPSWDEAWEAAWTAAVAGDAARDEAWVAARAAAWDAIEALIAWDHSARFLDMTPDELKMWSILSEDPAALLLLSAVRAFEQINELELA